MGLALAAVIGVVFFLVAERALLWYARKRFALVIHVNGTRGKSTVTRMIHAMLRCRGMAVFGKTTGSAARLLMPDGREKPVLRFGPANIREQRNIMIMCAFAGSRVRRQDRALVFECNAVQEELQYVCAKWLKPDITVITNVREDHVLELGTAEQAARIFAAAIPGNSALVTSESAFKDIWETAAKQNNLRLYHINPLEAGACVFPENAACVFGVADFLEIDRAQALESTARHKPDTGAFAVYSWKDNQRRVFFADARAANDIESTNRLATAALRITPPGARRILLLVNREDRPDRTELFMRYIMDKYAESCFDEYLCLGHTPFAFRRAVKRRNIYCRFFSGIKALTCALTRTLPESGEHIYIFAVGNFGGKGRLLSRWLEAKRREPGFEVLQ